MFRALINGSSILADEYDRHSEAICPNCSDKVIFVDGLLVAKHFRHRAENLSCNFEPESDEHINMKVYFYRQLQKNPHVKNLNTEVKIGDQIADVYFEYHNLKCVIECQCSLISAADFLDRDNNWQSKGCYTLWVFGDNFVNSRRKIINEYVRHDRYYYTEGVLIKQKFEWQTIQNYLEEDTKFIPRYTEEMITDSVRIVPILNFYKEKQKRELMICEIKPEKP